MRLLLLVTISGAGGLSVVPRRAVLAFPSALLVGGPAVASASTAGFLQGIPLESDVPMGSLTRRSRSAADDEPIDSPFAQRVVASQERALKSTTTEPSRKITERVRLDVRCARTDGSFSTRVEDPDPPLLGSIDISLFGDAAPASVALFLTFAVGELSDGPTYARSLFDQVSEDGALIIGGKIKGVDERLLFGTEKVLLYRGEEALSPRCERVSRMARAENNRGARLSHDAPNLLTRKRRASGLELPEFGLTTRAAPELDAEWVVLGEVTADSSRLLAKIAGLPRYSDVAVGPITEASPLAAEVFNAQKRVFTAAAKSIGDTRVSGVFPGKILRRVEVTRTALL